MVDFSKRNLLGAPVLAALGYSAVTAGTSNATTAEGPQPTGQTDYNLPITKGPFEATQASLEAYEVPEWFRDAKFGIWSHWGPQAVPRFGDWYARWMYVPGHPAYAHHVKTYGHPSEFGYKDIIPLWKAEKFNPEGLMDKYADAGAKYFVSMGVHHDNFDLWNSRHHRWNAVAMGPKRDIVGEWQAAARNRGLRFGVSEHLATSHNWWHPSHAYDQFWSPPDWSKMGKPYDGANPDYADLYHPPHNEPYLGNGETWYTKNPKFHQLWFNRIRDLIDTYQPDLLYSDGGIPFGVVGRSLIAHLYNQNIARNGKLDVVYNAKDLGSGEFYKDALVQDVERGVLKGINPLPWQTCSSNGDWYYSDNYKYKTAPEVISMLADIVSKNGNLLLNVVQYADGSLPLESQTLLDELAPWMKVNGEAIHGTRPWKIFGEGPTEAVAGAFQENGAYTAQDIRFTTKGKILYAITLGEPKQTVTVSALGHRAGHEARKVRRVDLLGVKTALKFRQSDDALLIDVPAALPTRHASAFKITFQG